jgi:catechol 2,3-dioxygenase-like lactoylglutathione lyase family enzyme
MNARHLIPAAIVAASVACSNAPAIGQTNMLPAPGFHHLHLNSLDPEAAIGFYTRQFPSTLKSTWGGFPALKSPNNVLVLFSKVAQAPATEPDTAYWHFGWHVLDVRKQLEAYKSRPEVKILPLYTSDEGGSVVISSDTWPGTSGVLGLTKAQIAEARTKGTKPAGGGGFVYIQGPDNAIIETLGQQPVERFNHVHMWHEDPLCAQIWYQKHLNASVPPARAPTTPLTEANCKVPRASERTWPSLDLAGTYRTPAAAVIFGDVQFSSYMRQGEQPLVATRGHLYDHAGLSVADLDAWIAKLRGEGVKFLDGPYTLGDTRALMIEGPSREAIELVEIK